MSGGRRGGARAREGRPKGAPELEVYSSDEDLAPKQKRPQPLFPVRISSSLLVISEGEGPLHDLTDRTPGHYHSHSPPSIGARTLCRQIPSLLPHAHPQ